MSTSKSDGGSVAGVKQIWSEHWSAATRDATWPLRDRFAVEAFASFREFVTERDATILEVGCGTGRFCAFLSQQHPSAKIVGVDISSSALEVGRRLMSAIGAGNVTLIEASLFQLPFPDGYFDVVLSEGLLCLFPTNGRPSMQDGFDELLRVLRPNGKIILCLPNRLCLPHVGYKWLLEKRGRRYEYGFEKSFGRSELHEVLRVNGVVDPVFAGFYPAYGFYRVASRVPRLRLVGTIMGRLVDLMNSKFISRVFGFYIVAMGRKAERNAP
jgi:ubiquinone/menaquinone biosynthesis C-methylase UbiE